MKYAILLIVASLLSLKSYSQNTKDINEALGIGLECCENYTNRTQQLLFMDSIVAEQAIKIDRLNDQVFLSNANAKLTEMRETALMKEIQERGVELAREHRRKRTWRTLFFISSGLLAGYYGYNSIK